MTSAAADAGSAAALPAGADPAAARAADATTTTTAPAAFAALAHRDFALFWGSAVVSNICASMQAIVVPFVVFKITNSTAWIGASTAIAFVPSLVLGPLAGSLADRYPRRKVLLINQAVQMAAATGLWLVWTTGNAGLGPLLALLLLQSVSVGLSLASWQAFVPSLVPRRDLMSAVRLNSIQFTLAQAVGPALGGVVLAAFGAGAAFGVNAVSFVLVLSALAVVRPRPAPPRETQQSFRAEFVAGVSYVRRRPSLLYCVTTTFGLSALTTSLVQLAPALAEHQLSVGATGYGFLVAAFGIGSMVAGVQLAVYGDRHLRSRAVMAGLVGTVLGLGLLAGASGFILGFVALFTVGFAKMLVSTTLNTALQLQVDDAYRGRVLSLYLMGTLSGLPLGTLVLGAVADPFGTRTMSVVAAAAAAVLVAAGLVRGTGLRALDLSRLTPGPVTRVTPTS